MKWGRVVFAVAVPASVLLLQYAVFGWLPAIAKPAAYLAMVILPLLAAAAVVWRGHQQARAVRIGWYAIALGLGIWSLGAFGNLWQEWVLGRVNQIYRASMLAFYLAAMPFAFVLADDWQLRSRRSARLVDAMVALALGIGFFLYNWSMLTARGQPDEAGVVFVIWLLDLQNAVLTLGALIRWLAADPARPERKLFSTMLCYQLVYQALLFYNNHFLAGNPAYGPEDSAIANVSFGVIAACALYGGAVGPGWRVSARFSRLTRAASPMVLAALLLLVSLALVRIDYVAGTAGVVIAALAYVLRSTQNQARHIERGDVLKQQRTALHAIAWSDALTGLANRRQLDQQLENMVRKGLPLLRHASVLMIDIDHFKLLNDHYGHLAGDACLQRVAAVMRGALGRGADLIGRYGGEEFMVLLDQVDEEGAGTVAENLRQAVMGLGIENRSGVEPVVTVSIGTASALAGTCITGQALVAAADQALYAAKRQGRNRVRSLTVDAVSAQHPLAL